MISMESICDWAGTNPAQRKFIEEERTFRARHIIKCGKNEENVTSDIVSFTAFCLQTSKLKDKPYEINSKVTKDGKILSCLCTCKAGLGEKCKHVIATLLFCYQEADGLQFLSCTDKSCSWKQVRQKTLSNYEAASILKHACFSNPIKKIKLMNENNMKTDKNKKIETEQYQSKAVNLNSSPEITSVDNSVKVITATTMAGNNPKQRDICETLVFSESQKLDIKNKIIMKLKNSAFTKHRLGRHNQITVEEKTVIPEAEKHTISVTFQLQENELIEAIKNLEVGDVKECCQNVFHNLSGDFPTICENSKVSYAYWHEERKYRITGSICYKLYTYTKNKSADWKKRSQDTFTPKNFKSEFTEYGKKEEKFARDVFIQKTGKTVFESGLVCCRQNPWIAFHQME